MYLKMWSPPSVVAEWGRGTVVPPYINSCPVPACHGLVLVVLARPDFLGSLKGSVLVDLRWSPAQLSTS
jgi:hypothetical protein